MKNKLDQNEKSPVEQSNEGYWQDIHQKVLDHDINKDEFKEGEFDSFSVVKNRRDFLKIMGFSFTMLPMAACTKGHVQKAIPYLEKTDLVTPGLARWYATSFDGLPVLLKTREGRPIKVEGNDLSVWTKGGANAIAQASLLSLYDSYRIQRPTKDAGSIVWSALVEELKAAMIKAKAENKKVVLITDEMRSPSSVSLINDLEKKYGNLEHVVYSHSTTGLFSHSLEEMVDVDYDLSKVNYVVGIESDFLGADKNAVYLSKQYSSRKDVQQKQEAFKHVQLESGFSLTGSNADERIPLNPDELKMFLLVLLAKIEGSEIVVQASSDVVKAADKVVRELLANKGKALLFNGISDIDCQKIVSKINVLIGAFQSGIYAYKNPYYRATTIDKFEQLVDSLAQKKTDVDVIIFVDVNPYYDYYNLVKLEEAFGRVPTKFAFSFAENETTTKSQYVAPLSHQYESWNDYVVANNEIVVTQPVIVNLYETKQMQDVFLLLLERSEGFHLYMKEVWQKNFWNDKIKFPLFDSFWNTSVQEGVFAAKISERFVPKSVIVDESIKRIQKSLKNGENLYLSLYEKSTIGRGQNANNPWLQELPDPITKVTWDNYAMISPDVARKFSISTGDMIEVKQGGNVLIVPALVQPGLAKKSLAIALGYGRSVCGKVGQNLGKNAYPFTYYTGKSYSRMSSDVSVKKTGQTYQLAMTQTHHSIEGRDLFRETTLEKFLKNPKSGNENKAHVVTMWSEHKNKEHQWAMAIDLNKCNGCSSCVVSCNAENNVPVVGREEVLQRREMHWLRIDRYYKGDENNPIVAHQPMTCHHCDNAPCETVCPVLATVQSSEGLNQQVYNRCVGTRYCANNCPYKVRRFNWFDYPHTDPNERMVLNPDVSVRSRGVMEKCSMCIQRIQEAKLVAKKEGRELKDGDIKLACQQSCSSDAIVFGDLKDPNSKISQMLKDPRNFTVLEELNVKPRVSYLTKIRNKE